MSGGVDSSVAAAVLADSGHDVVGATLKLWGGASDSGCCSVADVDDARRVAEQLGLDHHVFNFTDAFEESVVTPYVADHAAGRTPNPCIECNRTIKFGLLLERAPRLGFDALATGHHARIAGGIGAVGSVGGVAGGCACGAGRPGQGPVLRAVDAQRRRAGPGGAPGRGVDQGRGAGPGRARSGCAPRTSPTARTSASSTPADGRRASSADRMALHGAEIGRRLER